MMNELLHHNRSFQSTHLSLPFTSQSIAVASFLSDLLSSPFSSHELSNDDKRRKKLVPGGLLKAELRPTGGDSRPSNGDQVMDGGEYSIPSSDVSDLLKVVIVGHPIGLPLTQTHRISPHLQPPAPTSTVAASPNHDEPYILNNTAGKNFMPGSDVGSFTSGSDVGSFTLGSDADSFTPGNDALSFAPGSWRPLRAGELIGPWGSSRVKLGQNPRVEESYCSPIFSTLPSPPGLLPAVAGHPIGLPLIQTHRISPHLQPPAPTSIVAASPNHDELYFHNNTAEKIFTPGSDVGSFTSGSDVGSFTPGSDAKSFTSGSDVDSFSPGNNALSFAPGSWRPLRAGELIGPWGSSRV
ncbi:hypothetical protein Droror1_Dr00006949 [Drosera rotundifolia]